jgi:hypothetical protein
MGTNPVFPNRESDLGHGQPGHLSMPYAATSEGQPRTLNMETDIATLNSILKENFDNLKTLAQLNGQRRETISIDEEDSNKDSDTLYRTERSLLTLANIWGPRKFVTSGCLAAIIFIDNILRGISFRAQIMDRVVERLQHALDTVLDDIPQHNLKENAARAILWSLISGAIAAVGVGEKSIFVFWTADHAMSRSFLLREQMLTHPFTRTIAPVVCGSSNEHLISAMLLACKHGRKRKRY